MGHATNDLQGMVRKAVANDTVLVAEGVTVLGGYPSNATSSTTIADRMLPATGFNLAIISTGGYERTLSQYRI